VGILQRAYLSVSELGFLVMLSCFIACHWLNMPFAAFFKYIKIKNNLYDRIINAVIDVIRTDRELLQATKSQEKYKFRLLSLV